MKYYLSEIRGVVEKGWCHPKTKHLEMDGELAEAISDEVLQWLLDGEGKDAVHLTYTEAIKEVEEMMKPSPAPT